MITTVSPPSVSRLPDARPTVAAFAEEYIAAHIRDLKGLPFAEIGRAVELFRSAHRAGRRIFIFGNGGSAANASHFATDLGKGASDALGRRFKVLSLTDNVAWLTAIGND